VLCYFTYPNERDCGARIQTVLDKAGLRAALLRSGTVAAEKRKAWIEERVDQIDILLCHPDVRRFAA
jgi:superfamily II DNA helicase RecQ